MHKCNMFVLRGANETFSPAIVLAVSRNVYDQLL